MKTWETEQRAIKEHKDKERALQEFDAEMEYRKTLSFLSPEQAAAHIERQSVSFMYQKPPGYDAAIARDKEKAALESSKASDTQNKAESTSAPGTAAGPSIAPGAKALLDANVRDKVLLDPFKNVLQARAALANDNKLIMRSCEPSSSYGGFHATDPNQRLILDDDDDDGEDGRQGAASKRFERGEGSTEEDELLKGLSKRDRKRVLKRLREEREREEWEHKVIKAEAVLKAAGYYS
jgi:CBF1 interacting corepressor